MNLSQAQLQKITNHQARKLPQQALLDAAVAIILRRHETGTQALMMQRAFDQRDPWSGQMAFPGGKIEAGDDSAYAAAVRETAEEVAVDLQPKHYLGQLNDFYGMRINQEFSVHVSVFVFSVNEPLSPVGNHEVSELVWVPLSYYQQPQRFHALDHPLAPDSKAPSLRLNADRGQYVWGMSLRMMINLFEVIGEPITVLDDEALAHCRQLDKSSINN